MSGPPLSTPDQWGPVVVAGCLASFAVQYATLPLVRLLAPQELNRLVDFAGTKEEGTKRINELPTVAVAFCHAVFAFQGCARGLLNPDPVFNEDALYGFSSYSQFYFALSTGYFLWDLIVSLWQGWGIGFVAHAVACLFVYSMSLHPFLHYHGMFFLMYEASTPFLHMRWYLLHTGRRDGTAMAVVQALFALAFFIVRLCLGYPVSYMWWGDMLHLLNTGTAHSVFVVVGYLACNIVLNGLNALWFYQIVAGALKRSAKQKVSQD